MTVVLVIYLSAWVIHLMGASGFYLRRSVIFLLIIVELHPTSNCTYMGIARCFLPQNIANLPLPFFGDNDPIVLLDNIY